MAGGGPTVAVFGSSCTTSRGCQWLPVVCRVLGAAGDGDDEIKIGPGRCVAVHGCDNVLSTDLDALGQ